MEHRTYGKTNNCKGCRYWSEMLAMSEGCAVKAMCLSSRSPQGGKYTYWSQSCNDWADGYLGAVDEPGIHEEYAAEEGPPGWDEPRMS